MFSSKKKCSNNCPPESLSDPNPPSNGLCHSSNERKVVSSVWWAAENENDVCCNNKRKVVSSIWWAAEKGDDVCCSGTMNG